MPIFPMQRLDATPLRWRSLFAPGGSEFYEIRIPTHDFLFRIGIGNPFSEIYRRRDRRYRRCPTRNRPALPAEFPFAWLRYQGQTSLFDPPGATLQWDDATLELGPAKLSRDGTRVECSWKEVVALSLKAEASGKISTTMTAGAAICEISSLRMMSSPFSEAPCTFSHLLTAHLTDEFAAHYLQSIP